MGIDPGPHDLNLMTSTARLMDPFTFVCFLILADDLSLLNDNLKSILDDLEFDGENFEPEKYRRNNFGQSRGSAKPVFQNGLGNLRSSQVDELIKLWKESVLQVNSIF